MSLRIKKGSKVWGPKAPVARRQGVASSEPPSARPSVERQSQTPVPLLTPAESPLVLEAVQEEATENAPVIESTTVFQSRAAESSEQSISASITGAGSANNLKRKESSEEKIPPSPPPKRTRVEEAPPQPPILQQTRIEEAPLQPPPLQRTRIEEAPPQPPPSKQTSIEEAPPQPPPSKQISVAEAPPQPPPAQLHTLSRPVKPSPPSVEENQRLVRSPPVLENRQDIESSVYPDPELSSGLGPAGGISSTSTAIAEGAGLVTTGIGDLNAAQISQAPQIVPTGRAGVEGTDEILQDPAAGLATKKKAIRKRRKVQPTVEEDGDVRATLEMQLNAPRRLTNVKRNRKKKEKEGTANKRGATPEGAESEQINPSTMKMAELCRDIRIGVKSSNHDMIKKRLIEKKTRAKLARTNPELASLIESEQPEGQSPAAEFPEDPTPSGPQMRIVNGQIVLAESSLRLDRHKRAEAENEVMVEVEENEFSHMTTSGTFMKRERAQIWDAAANTMFFAALASYGTDFEMIAKLFPNRNRKQIKLKFNSEERKNPARLNMILMNKSKAIDLDEFQEVSGLKLEEVADIEKERLEIAEEQEREVQAREKERTDADLQKKKDIADRSGTFRRDLEGDELDEGGSGKENRSDPRSLALALAIEAQQSAAFKGQGNKKGQPKPKKKKNPHGRGDGGDIVEVLGSVE